MATRTARGTRTPVPIYTDNYNPFLTLAEIPDLPGIYPSRVQLINESASATNILVKTEVAHGDERISIKNGPGEGYELIIAGGTGVIIDNVGPGKIIVSTDTDQTLLTWAVKFQQPKQA